MLHHRHRDPVAGPHVVQQEIPERMKHLVAERWRNRVGAAVDHRAGRGGREGTDVAQGAADVVEQLRSSLRLRGRRQHAIARRRLGRPHEPGEPVDVLEPGRVRGVVGLRDRVAQIGHFLREQPAGDPHFVEVRVPGE